MVICWQKQAVFWWVSEGGDHYAWTNGFACWLSDYNVDYGGLVGNELCKSDKVTRTHSAILHTICRTLLW